MKILFFVLERQTIHLFIEWKISKVHSLYELFNFDGGGEPSINFYFKLRYNPVSKSVAFFIVYHNTDQKSKGNLPLIGLLNLETLETNYLPIYHTDFLRKIMEMLVCYLFRIQ